MKSPVSNEEPGVVSNNRMVLEWGGDSVVVPADGPDVLVMTGTDRNVRAINVRKRGPYCQVSDLNVIEL